MLRWLIDWNVRLSRGFDRTFLPREMWTDGNFNFKCEVVPRFLLGCARICDVGGGKNPWLSAEDKVIIGCHYIGLDIDANELSEAPVGRYDEICVFDLCNTDDHGIRNVDLSIVDSCLEHTRNNEQALAHIIAMLRPGGIAVCFMPSRYASFARLNRILPQKLKQSLLYAIYPETKFDQGFKVYYNRCTLKDIEAIARLHGAKLIESHKYFTHGYFRWFAPLHVIWRLSQVIARTIGVDTYETFYAVLRRET